MKRTFRKALACLLAVLMVLTAAPLSALAFEPVDGKNIGWWGDSNFDATKNDTLYNLVNEDGSPIEPAYTTAATEFEFGWADSYEVGDLELEGDLEELLLDQMKPVITVTVCEMGHSAAGDYPSASAKPTAAAAKTYYGNGTYLTLDSLPTAEDAFGRVINPAELKTGQRIAVTFELGGIDANYATQLKGIADPEYLAFGAYSATRNWATYTTGTSANPFVGNFYSYYGDAASNGGSMICDCATGQFYTPFASNTSVPTSAYTGPEVREKGEHGMFVCTIEFEVLKDCDLSEVLHLDRDKDNNPAWGTTQVIPYDADGSSDINKYFTFDPNDTLHTAGLIALNYTAYDAGSGPEPTTQYTVTFKNYAGETVSSVAYDEGTAAADVTVPANTASDAQYTYAWPTVADVTADVTYKETRSTNSYTVTFVNDAGVTVAEDTYEYGATPVAPANTPTDIGEQVTTTYSWPEIATVTGDATYNEQSTTTPTTYTVDFVNYAGQTVDSQTLAYGATPVAPANTASDAQYTYAWPTVATVTGNATYNETRTVNEYDVTWVFADDRENQVDTLAYGAAITAPTNSSIKVGNVTTTYKWVDVAETVTGDVTYTEVKDKEITDAFTVTFVNYAGETVSADSYEAGTAAADVVVPANTASDAQYSYAWPTVADVTGDVTYNETRTVNEYTVTFVNAAGATVSEKTYPYGTAAENVEIAENTADTAQYTYAWPEVVAVTGDAVYNEIQEVRNYTVTFVNYAGVTVAEDTYEYGATPVAPANTASDAQYSYAWPTVADVTGDVTYNETRTVNEYTVTFINAAGVTVAEDTYEYGATPVAPANTENTKRTTYAWPEIADVTADATYNEVVTDLGYKVTVNGADLAEAVTVNGTEVGDGTTINVPLNSTVTLVATPVDGATFVGWTSGGKTVSTNATFSTTVVADVEYTPVFELDTEAQFTVVFVDKFGNVVDTQTVTSGDQIVVPAAPAISGYVAGTDNGWSLTNDEIAALTAAATVKAVYEAAPVTTGYTVTANGATITYKGEETADTLSGLPYDAQVTLYNAEATSWVVNDVTVAYGDSYTFYVGADVNVSFTTAAVAQAPSIVGVSVGKVGSDGAYQGTFLASFNLADGKFVKAGYIYGKGATDASTLDDVDGTNVKAMYFNATPTQFQLNYGYRAQTGTITAIAFLVYKDAAGQNQVIYAAPQVFDYANMPA